MIFLFDSEKNIQFIDFNPFEYSNAGAFGSNAWKNKAKLPESKVHNFEDLVEENMLKIDSL